MNLAKVRGKNILGREGSQHRVRNEFRCSRGSEKASVAGGVREESIPELSRMGGRCWSSPLQSRAESFSNVAVICYVAESSMLGLLLFWCGADLA